MYKSHILLITIILSLWLSGLHSQTATPGYRLAGKIALEGDGGWDNLTVDEPGNRLFLSHGNMVQVVDLVSGKPSGTIPDTKGVHGIALAHGLNKGYISCGKDSSVTVFDMTTLKPLRKIGVTGRNPGAILYDRPTGRLLTFNAKSANATVIDAAMDKVVSTIPLPGKPAFSVSDNMGRIYVNIEDKNLVCLIDARSMTVAASWPLAPGEEPSGLALDNESHRLFAVCANKQMVVLDAMKGRFIASLPIGEHPDGVVFDPVLKRAYSANGDGSITVVQQEPGGQYKVLETLQTQPGARTIAFHPQTHHLYLPVAEYVEKPAATPEKPDPRPAVRPGTFTLLDIEPVK